MAESLTRSQVNKLGERLRNRATDVDLRLLSAYRESHSTALEETIRVIEFSTGLHAVGRPKTNQSIIEKLRRLSTRLNQMQDIVGCRLVVDGPLRQQTLIDKLSSVLPNCVIADRRNRPSHGYRAVHLVTEHLSGRCVEIQIRTELQDLWAQCSERLADLHGIEVKYGGGTPEVAGILVRFSELIRDIEAEQMKLSIGVASHIVRDAPLPNDAKGRFQSIDAGREALQSMLKSVASVGDRLPRAIE